MTYFAVSGQRGVVLDFPLVSPTAAVAIEALTMSYGGRPAVRDLSLLIATGRITVVLGPNGAGKTTTIEVCEGLRPIQQGSVRVLGLVPRSRELRSRVGVMLQSGGCYSGARAPELVRHFAKLYRSPQDPTELIALLGLDALGRTTYRRMSGGERARLSLALSIVGRPELVFLDEPSAGLDPQARLVLWDLISALRSAGVTVVLTTHQLDEAERLADDIVIITDGQVRQTAALAELVAGGEPVITLRTVSDLDLSDLLLLLGPRATALRSAPDTYVISGRPDPIALATVATWAASHGHPLRELSMGNRGLAAKYLEIVGDLDGS